MRYIKLYKFFESDDSIKEVSEVIGDILLDISDNGFPYIDKPIIFNKKIMAEVSGMPNNTIGRTFEVTNEIIDVIKRCIEYSESQGYLVQLHFNRYIDEDLNDNGSFNPNVKSDEIETQQGSNVYFIGITISKK